VGWWWPFRKKYGAIFSWGFLLIVIPVMSLVDHFAHDLGRDIRRALDIAVIAAYGLGWLAAYWLRPDLFDSD
jgi:hypothetical protein